jgi:hypothetical protein
LGGLSGPAPAADRSGDYMELQVGPAYTQFQTFDLPSDATLEWTEVFGAFEGDSAQLHSTAYGDAVAEVEAWLTSPDGVNDTAFLATDAWLAALADVAPDAVVASGSPWGAVEEIRRAAALGSSEPPRGSSRSGSGEGTRPGAGGLRTGVRGSGSSGSGSQLAPGLVFDHDAAWASPETRPWCELASNGAFSADTLASQPLSYQVCAQEKGEEGGIS